MRKPVDLMSAGRDDTRVPEGFAMNLRNEVRANRQPDNKEGASPTCQ
jgi:hypothetical protein